MTIPNNTQAVVSHGNGSIQRPAMATEQLRYRINEVLLGLPHAQYRQAMKDLPALLGISLPTWRIWRRLMMQDTADIPALKLLVIAKYLGQPVSNLLSADAVAVVNAVQCMQQEGGVA